MHNITKLRSRMSEQAMFVKITISNFEEILAAILRRNVGAWTLKHRGTFSKSKRKLSGKIDCSSSFFQTCHLTPLSCHVAIGRFVHHIFVICNASKSVFCGYGLDFAIIETILNAVCYNKTQRAKPVSIRIKFESRTCTELSRLSCIRLMRYANLNQ